MSFHSVIACPEVAPTARPAACHDGVGSGAGAPAPAIDAEAFRDGLFALRTRRFGTVAELLIERLTGAGRARSIFHDLFDASEDARIEVKFATVNAKHEATITAETLFAAVAAAAEPRAISFPDWEKARFDCNIQQVKPAEFDILYYGLFFHDRIVIFRIGRADLLYDGQIRYSDRQHKGNVGEGQFHLNQRTLRHHLDNYHLRDLSYAEFISLFSDAQ